MSGRMRIERLLQSLMSVRHSHLQPLEAVTTGSTRTSLHFGEPGACAAGCEGLWGALRAVHRAGLWVGDVSLALGRDDTGRVVLIGVGTRWDLRDPFAGHPSVGRPDLRVRWRQQADRLQVSGLAGHLVRCS